MREPSKARKSKLTSVSEMVAGHIGHEIEYGYNANAGKGIIERLEIDWDIWGVKVWLQKESPKAFPKYIWMDVIRRCATCNTDSYLISKSIPEILL